jgi:hypothetical protein
MWNSLKMDYVLHKLYVTNIPHVWSMGVWSSLVVRQRLHATYG